MGGWFSIWTAGYSHAREAALMVSGSGAYWCEEMKGMVICADCFSDEHVPLIQSAVDPESPVCQLSPHLHMRQYRISVPNPSVAAPRSKKSRLNSARIPRGHSPTPPSGNVTRTVKARYQYTTPAEWDTMVHGLLVNVGELHFTCTWLSGHPTRKLLVPWVMEHRVTGGILLNVCEVGYSKIVFWLLAPFLLSIPETGGMRVRNGSGLHSALVPLLARVLAILAKYH
ncbi:hypothetical protein OG21DRAFT_1605254 [Imleria badia]|nr:hypothetical protein OG21DRAFT_1605254 [Imleria badia]